MLRFFFVWWVIGTGPLFCQRPAAADPYVKDGEFRWFRFTESQDDVKERLGPTQMVMDFGTDFRSWQYQIGEVVDHDDFSLAVVFRRSTGALVSVTRNFDRDRNVDSFFPESETSAYYFPDAKKPQYSLRLRRLSGGRLLLAMGASKAGQPTSQLVLIRESELRYFFDWLSDQLLRGTKDQH